MPQIDLASWSSPSRAVFPSGAQERGLSIATTAGGFVVTRSTTCWHVMRLWSTRTRRSSMTAASKPFRFPPTSTPIHRATSQSMPHPVHPHAVRMRRIGQVRDCHRHGHSSMAERSRGGAPALSLSAANYGPTRLRVARPGDRRPPQVLGQRQMKMGFRVMPSGRSQAWGAVSGYERRGGCPVAGRCAAGGGGAAVAGGRARRRRRVAGPEAGPRSRDAFRAAGARRAHRKR